MKKIILILLGLTILAGCGSKKDASKKNFGAAIEQYLAKDGKLCLDISNLSGIKVTKWPISVSEYYLKPEYTKPTEVVGQLNALVAIGLASKTDTEIDEVLMSGGHTGKKIKAKRYALTDEGKKFYSEDKDKDGHICYGKKSLDEVVKWEGPMKFGDYQEASVMYLYKIEDLADWTKKPEFLASFPDVEKIIENAGKEEQEDGVKLTSEGWESKSLNSRWH